MKPFIIVPDGFDKQLFEELKKFDAIELHPTSKVSQDELKTLLPRCHGLIIRSATTVNPELLALAPNLKIVIRAGEGTDNIDKAACEARDVVVENTPGANSNSVAELAMALMLTLLRKTAIADKTMKDGKWEKATLSGNEITGKKVGLIGFGKISQLLAHRLQGFDVEILYHTRSQTKSSFSYARQAKDLKEIFSCCDIISIHVPSNAESKNMITKDLLSLMKKDAIIINTARGGIINEDDLYEVLKENKIRGAGIDVYAKEPIEPNHKFLGLTNVVLCPHIGASTDEAQYRVGEIAVAQLKEFVLNKKVLNQVKAKK